MKLNKKKIRYQSYLFSFCAFLILLHTLFSDESELQKQSIQWFYVSLISALIPSLNDFIVIVLIPNLKSVKIQELEITFKEKLEQLDKKTEAIKSSFVEAIEAVKSSESTLPDSYKEMRQNVYESYHERLKISLKKLS